MQGVLKGLNPASMKERVLVENKGYLKDCNPGFKERGEKLTFFLVGREPPI